MCSGEDGRSRAEQLLHILRQVDQFVSSSEEHQRRRGCLAVYETLQKFRTLCSSGYYGLGQQSVSMHNKHTERAFQRKFSNLPCNSCVKVILCFPTCSFNLTSSFSSYFSSCICIA